MEIQKSQYKSIELQLVNLQIVDYFCVIIDFGFLVV